MLGGSGKKSVRGQAGPTSEGSCQASWSGSSFDTPIWFGVRLDGRDLTRDPFLLMQTPAELGYRLPAEWELHEATWLSWPRRETISFPNALARVLPTLRTMVSVLTESERVCINVSDEAHEAEAREVLRSCDLSRITFHRVPTNEPWCRDHGPLFLKRADDPRLAIVDWDYNAWGGKYPPCDLDEVVPTRIGEILHLPVFYPRMILEGGSIDPNGSGALLTTESCLLNKNRNAQLSRDEIESRLCQFLGVHQILWLNRGIEGDDTDGHIDDLTRFVASDAVVTVVEDDPTNANYQPLQENLARLERMRLGDQPLQISTLPMPAKITREGLTLPASYANFYIANTAILLPTFDDPMDEKAKEILEKLFPNRRIIGIDCSELIWGLGAFHCLTQQQPAV